MPLYDYDCAACGRRFEVIHGVNDPPPGQCPLCGSGPVRKAFAAPAIHFKGSGWAKKERRAAAKSGTSSSKDGDAGSGSDKGADGDASSKTTEKASTPSGDSGSTTSSASGQASTSAASGD